MTGAEMKEAIRELGLSQVAFSDLLGVDGSSVRRWLSGSMAITEPVARYTRLLLANPDLLQQAWEIAGLPDGRSAAPRGRPRKKST